MAGGETNCVVTFSTTSDAMAVQAASLAGTVPGRMVPVPSSISAGCGLAWSVPAAQRDELLAALAREGLAYEAVHEV